MVDSLGAVLCWSCVERRRKRQNEKKSWGSAKCLSGISRGERNAAGELTKVLVVKVVASAADQKSYVNKRSHAWLRKVLLKVSCLDSVDILSQGRGR